MAGTLAARPMSSSLAEQLSEKLTEKLAQWGFSWQGLRDNRHGEWWLLGQLSLIALHLLPPLPAPASYGIVWPLALRLGAGALLAWVCCWRPRPPSIWGPASRPCRNRWPARP